MSRKIFVNLPVKDLDKSKSFFNSLGFSFNPQFTDATAACMVITHSFQDPDGHIWELVWMDPKFVQKS